MIKKFHSTYYLGFQVPYAKLVGRSIQHSVISFPLTAGNAAKSGQTVSRIPFVTDEDALALLRNRESDALRLLFDRYSRLVFSIGLRILGDPGESEEVVQDVFIRVFEKASLFDPQRGSAKTWITQLAFHRALDRRSYLTVRKFYHGTELDSLADTLWEQVDLETQVGAKLTAEQLRRAFEELTEKQRQTLELFFFEGMRFLEIAEKLSEPVGNIRHHYYRGLAKLRKGVFIQKIKAKDGDQLS
jgi:RNA polymerase sigma-70 factor (ECF subfamily)